MMCTICERSFVPSYISNLANREMCQQMRICGRCRMKLVRKIRKPPPSMRGKHHTKCASCGSKIDHWNKIPTCTGNSNCRQKYYNRLHLSKTLDHAAVSDDTSGIATLKVKTIESLGYTILVRRRNAGSD
jgi:hypothetical protein